MTEREKLMDKKQGWPTTRRYPRTLHEAFPDDVEIAKWWYPPEAHVYSVAEWFLMLFGVCAWIGIGYCFVGG